MVIIFEEQMQLKPSSPVNSLSHRLEEARMAGGIQEKDV